MYLGYLTSCLPTTPLEDKVKFAKEQGFKALEVAVWPRENERDYASSDIDVANLTQEEADRIKKMMDDNGLEITSLAYYDNNLDVDPEKRAFYNEHTRRVIDAAEMLGVPTVGTFVGRNIDKSLADNFDEFEEVFTELVGYAEEKGVKVIIENCPMFGWQRPNEPGALGFTPEQWHEMFRRVPNKNFGLNFDPSHLLLQHIDYLPLLEEFKDRIFHVHAKDAAVDMDMFHYYGVYNRILPDPDEHQFQNGYWRFNMPGLGQVDWKAFFEALKDIGYDGVVSIEHEDADYEGSEEKVFEGLAKGYEFLKELI